MPLNSTNRTKLYDTLGEKGWDATIQFLIRQSATKESDFKPANKKILQDFIEEVQADEKLQDSLIQGLGHNHIAVTRFAYMILKSVPDFPVEKLHDAIFEIALEKNAWEAEERERRMRLLTQTSFPNHATVYLDREDKDKIVLMVNIARKINPQRFCAFMPRVNSLLISECPGGPLLKLEDDCEKLGWIDFPEHEVPAIDQKTFDQITNIAAKGKLAEAIYQLGKYRKKDGLKISTGHMKKIHQQLKVELSKNIMVEDGFFGPSELQKWFASSIVDELKEFPNHLICRGLKWKVNPAEKHCCYLILKHLAPKGVGPSTHFSSNEEKIREIDFKLTEQYLLRLRTTNTEAKGTDKYNVYDPKKKYIIDEDSQRGGFARDLAGYLKWLNEKVSKEGLNEGEFPEDKFPPSESFRTYLQKARDLFPATFGGLSLLLRGNPTTHPGAHVFYRLTTPNYKEQEKNFVYTQIKKTPSEEIKSNLRKPTKSQKNINPEAGSSKGESDFATELVQWHTGETFEWKKRESAKGIAKRLHDNFGYEKSIEQLKHIGNPESGLALNDRNLMHRAINDYHGRKDIIFAMTELHPDLEPPVYTKKEYQELLGNHNGYSLAKDPLENDSQQLSDFLNRFGDSGNTTLIWQTIGVKEKYSRLYVSFIKKWTYQGYGALPAQAAQLQLLAREGKRTDIIARRVLECLQSEWPKFIDWGFRMAYNYPELLESLGENLFDLTAPLIYSTTVGETQKAMDRLYVLYKTGRSDAQRTADYISQGFGIDQLTARKHAGTLLKRMKKEVKDLVVSNQEGIQDCISEEPDKLGKHLKPLLR